MDFQRISCDHRINFWLFVSLGVGCDELVTCPGWTLPSAYQIGSSPCDPVQGLYGRKWMEDDLLKTGDVLLFVLL